LVITPKRPLRKNAPFTVKVEVESKVPGVTDPNLVFPPGLIHYGDWIQAINQPSGARRILAVSDHPAQKAPATISITAPARLNSIANGKLLSTVRTGSTTTRVFREDRRIATELLQIGVGPFTVVHARGPHGMDLRYAVPTAQLAAIKPQLKSFDEAIRFMEQRLGRFPGVRAGSYIAPVGGELETQGLSLMTADQMTKEGFEHNGVDGVVLHEISHEWFGNSVSPRTWSDLWLNEGHAVFYAQQWGAAHTGMSLTEGMKHTYVERGNKLLANGPIAKPDPAKWPGDSAALRPYGEAAYSGAALALYALQQKVGATVFNRIERTWVREHANGVAGTEDFIATASRTAHQDLGPFLRSWLYGTKLPAMPGHPDWKAAA
jgi:aminopeptidase N